jgi:hypothetical protein
MRAGACAVLCVTQPRATHRSPDFAIAPIAGRPRVQGSCRSWGSPAPPYTSAAKPDSSDRGRSAALMPCATSVPRAVASSLVARLARTRRTRFMRVPWMTRRCSIRLSRFSCGTVRRGSRHRRTLCPSTRCQNNPEGLLRKKRIELGKAQAPSPWRSLAANHVFVVCIKAKTWITGSCVGHDDRAAGPYGANFSTTRKRALPLTIRS